MNPSHETIFDDERMKLYFSVVAVTDELVPPHWHSHMEAIYIVKGEMTAYINDVSYTLTSGDILIVNPKDIHSTQTQPESLYYLLQIPPVHLERIGPNWESLHFEEHLPYSTKNPLYQKIADNFQKLYALYQAKPQGYSLLFLMQAYELLYTLSTEGASQRDDRVLHQNDRDFHRIERCMAYVKAHYREQISLQDISSELSIAPEYFCRLFKKYTGQTFLTYLNQIRMQYFYQDLLVSNDSVDYLLGQNGITNYKVFLRDFKKTYGTTPHKLRMQHRMNVSSKLMQE